MNEAEAERVLRRWLEARGYRVTRGQARSGPVNLAASSGRGETWIIQVRGDQRDERAAREEWFAGIGQLACIMTDDSTRYSLAVTTQYKKMIVEHVGALHNAFRSRLSVIVVQRDGVKELTKTSGAQGTPRRAAPSARAKAPSGRQAPAGQGHPDGVFSLKGYRYQVAEGKIAGVRHPYGEALPIKTFARLARELRIRVGSESASRVINRARQKAEP